MSRPSPSPWWVEAQEDTSHPGAQAAPAVDCPAPGAQGAQGGRPHPAHGTRSSHTSPLARTNVSSSHPSDCRGMTRSGHLPSLQHEPQGPVCVMGPCGHLTLSKGMQGWVAFSRTCNGSESSSWAVKQGYRRGPPPLICDSGIQAAQKTKGCGVSLWQTPPAQN